MNCGLDPQDRKVIRSFNKWAENLAKPEGALSRSVYGAPATVIVVAALRLACRIAATRPELFSRGAVEVLLKQQLDEMMPEEKFLA